MTIDKGQNQEGKEQAQNPQSDDKSVRQTDSGEKNSFFNNLVTFIGFGLAILALFLVMAVMKKVDNNIGQLKSSVKNLETQTFSLKTEMNEKLGYVDFEINDIKSKVKKSQRQAAIMELKRALVTVQEVSHIENSPELQDKSNQLVSGIESFLQDLSAETNSTPAGTIDIINSPVNDSIEK